MLQMLEGISNSRTEFSVSSGPPKVPSAALVSATRQGATGTKLKGPWFVAAGEAVCGLHSFTRRPASTEPSPVAWSYPTPAANPIVPFVQLGVPVRQATAFEPDVMSWNTSGDVLANE